mmetsp:Transcript_39383/g.113216  ORF Transcript_39383/g.113216 Transcript_39383/m.113216 type:complete len:331 (+) Transcript_39383:106-1098(+)
MTCMRMKPAILSAFLALLAGNSVQAWTTPVRTQSVVRTSFGKSVLSMAEGEKSDKVQLTSGKKEILFDEESGRFYETNLDSEECIPEEEFCTTDDETGQKIRLTVAEKERIFLDSLQSYYVNGRQLLADEDFDKLKEDLQWNGSPVVVLNRDEAKYLAAMEAYLKGSPILSDSEFDALKRQLKESGSKIAVETEPKCYIDTGVCKVTLQEDKFRSNLLYFPAGAILSVVWLGFGFELIEPLIRLNPLFLYLLGAPLIYNGSKKITEEFVFQNKFIAYGPCPVCEVENRVYFGNILGVEGFSDVAEVKCKNCKEMFSVQRATLRASTKPKV